MSRGNFRPSLACFFFAALWSQAAGAPVLAQTPAPAPAPPAAPKPVAKSAPAKAPSQVDSVIQLVKAGTPETLTIKYLQKQNKPVKLSTADLVKLQNAGVSENIINTLLDPTAAPDTSAPAPPPAAAAPPPVADVPAKVTKKRVIVDDFDYSTVMTSVQAVFGTNQDIGRGIKAMLTNKLTQQGRVVIVERAKIDSLMKEQDRDQGNRVKQGSGARVGRIVGADALLTGDITTFGRDDKKKGMNLASLAAFGGPLMSGAAAVISAATAQDKAVVAITYRLVDAETSEVIATGIAIGQSVRKTKAINALAAGFNKGAIGAAAGSFDMTSSNFQETIVGEATQDCVNKLADVLMTQAEAMKKTVRSVEASVADIAGNSLTITAGTNDDVNVGDIFEVLRVVHEVKDPATQEVLDRLTEKAGELTVTSVREKIATGTYQGQKPKIGYIARKKI